jgi:hypothetical protein
LLKLAQANPTDARERLEKELREIRNELEGLRR